MTIIVARLLLYTELEDGWIEKSIENSFQYKRTEKGAIKEVFIGSILESDVQKAVSWLMQYNTGEFHDPRT